MGPIPIPQPHGMHGQPVQYQSQYMLPQGGYPGQGMQYNQFHQGMPYHQAGVAAPGQHFAFYSMPQEGPPGGGFVTAPQPFLSTSPTAQLQPMVMQQGMVMGGMGPAGSQVFMPQNPAGAPPMTLAQTPPVQVPHAPQQQQQQSAPHTPPPPAVSQYQGPPQYPVVNQAPSQTPPLAAAQVPPQHGQKSGEPYIPPNIPTPPKKLLKITNPTTKESVDLKAAVASASITATSDTAHIEGEVPPAVMVTKFDIPSRAPHILEIKEPTKEKKTSLSGSAALSSTSTAPTPPAVPVPPELPATAVTAAAPQVVDAHSAAAAAPAAAPQVADAHSAAAAAPAAAPQVADAHSAAAVAPAAAPQVADAHSAAAAAAAAAARKAYSCDYMKKMALAPECNVKMAPKSILDYAEELLLPEPRPFGKSSHPEQIPDTRRHHDKRRTDRPPSHAIPQANLESLEEESSSFTCCVCCEPFFAVAVGACEHSEVCARCCMRMRMCYQDKRCPLCKHQNLDVVVMRPLPAAPTPQEGSSQQQQQQKLSSFSDLMSKREALWSRPKWANGVFVYESCLAETASKEGGERGRPGLSVKPLHVSLLQMTARSCRVCDRHGQRPFPSDHALQEHLMAAHGRQACQICVSAGFRFTLEHEVFTSHELAQHVHRSHPRCEFCRESFYGVDEQYKHMNEMHFSCHICQRRGAEHVYHKVCCMGLSMYIVRCVAWG
ncbi:hypothetical protein CEUSTIGMA_g13720.t1 [Chlamydomonas eustigma]|uniref:RING-type domain-containing protein n=1 Tax=Chlamydomonas eustigma TaxID=1157962 RepID=A0A250XTC2_9CHLO|nr:hypothetical protein CEUSTIGMA_g13720.t1 [Chlamydomonas eustigma]|eukprot:GAX86308.1 hypothetical protein CEUSTIGMA_g13720.t1 [Chlamydomonas eustigma]